MYAPFLRQRRWSVADELNLDELERLERLESKATPGPWEASCDGTNHAEQTEEFVFAGVHGTLFDTLNSDARLIDAEHDEDGSVYWDSTGRANMQFVAALRNAAPALLRAARELSALKALLAASQGATVNVPVEINVDGLVKV